MPKVEKFYDDGIVQILNCNALEGLRSLPDESVQMACTSPPYWGLRSYSGSEVKWPDGSVAQLGLEKTPDEYVSHLMMIFREVKRVLKKTGSLYLNIADTYASSWGNMSHEQARDYPDGRPPQSHKLDMQPKCMVCIPERVMFAMIQGGWVLRNKCIWKKGNPMPSSTKDRFTSTWEYVYFFTKSSTTLLWRNEETGEWRDTEPTKEEKYPLGGRYRNYETDEVVWDKPDDMSDWEHLTPVWHGFDYYFDLDSVRINHKTQSLERYQRQVNFGDRIPDSKYAEENPSPEGIQPMYREGRNLGPEWFQESHEVDQNYLHPIPKEQLEMFPELGVKTVNTDIFGCGPNPQAFNLRVRVEEYQYPEVERGDWRAEAAKRGQLFDQPVAHQGGGNTGLSKDARDRPLVSPHHLVKHDIAVDRTGNVSYTDPLHTKDYHSKGKNPGDTLTERQENIVGHFEEKGSGGHYLYGGIESPEGTHEHPRGKNPGDSMEEPTDYWEINTAPYKGAHFAVYPEKLVETPIKSSSRVGDTVLDPFGGSGTTGAVAKKLGRKAIITDMVESYCKLAKERIEKIVYQPELEV